MYGKHDTVAALLIQSGAKVPTGFGAECLLSETLRCKNFSPAAVLLIKRANKVSTLLLVESHGLHTSS